MPRHMAVELICDCTTPPIIEKLQSKGVAMHTYSVSIYDLHVNQKSIKWPWVEPFKMNVKIE